MSSRVGMSGVYISMRTGIVRTGWVRRPFTRPFIYGGPRSKFVTEYRQSHVHSIGEWRVPLLWGVVTRCVRQFPGVDPSRSERVPPSDEK